MRFASKYLQANKIPYEYDAWGNHRVYDASGSENTEDSFIGNINAIRYRGYYYDTETGLYYLQTRYYDSETGRFISPDSGTNIEPTSLGEMGLYAYCGYNPVMNVDPSGEFALSLLIAVIAGAVVGGVVGGISSSMKGESFWAGAFSGALIGGALGAAFFVGGASMLAIAGKATFGLIKVSTLAAKLGLFVGNAVGSTLLSAGAGMGAYAINERMNGREINTSEMLRHGVLSGIKGGVAFFTGMTLATTGAFNYLINGVDMTIKERLNAMIVRSAASSILQFPWRIGLR